MVASLPLFTFMFVNRVRWPGQYYKIKYEVSEEIALRNLKMLDSQNTRPRPTVKHNLRFQEGIFLEKIQPDQIQNRRLSAIIDTNMHNTGKS